MNKNLDRKFLAIPVIFLVIFFLGNILTLIKGGVLAAVIFIFHRKKNATLTDVNFICLFVFIFVYFIISFYNGYEKTIFNPQLITCLILYLAGRWVGFQSIDGKSVVKIFWVVGLGLSLTALLSVFLNIAQYGFSGEGRNIKSAIDDNEISATVLAGLLIVLVAYGGAVFSNAKVVRLIERIWIFTFFVLAIAASIRLGSRTILLIGVISFILGALVNIKGRRLWVWVPLIILFIYFIYLTLDNIGRYIDIFSYYQDRQDNDQVGVSSAGGRTEKWKNSISLMIQYPLGWSISINGYSHNLWLDAARNGGIPSFFMALVVSIMAIRSFIKTLSRNANDKYYTTTVICVSTSYFLLFCVEPILDGFIYVFASFCCLWGIASAHTSVPRRRAMMAK